MTRYQEDVFILTKTSSYKACDDHKHHKKMMITHKENGDYPYCKERL